MSSKDVSVIGLGKLGLCMAAVLGARGFRVIGVDSDRMRVEQINRGICPIYEPGIKPLLASIKGRFDAVTDYREAIQRTRTTFIVVPTPSGRDGQFSLKYVLAAIREIGRELRDKRGYHLVVVTSTIMPGSMDSKILPMLESVSYRHHGKNLGLCYSPEFIALGNVIKGLVRPDFVLIGESDSKAGRTLARVQRQVCGDRAVPIERMNFINAELAKIAINSYVTMKVSFSNMLAEMCEKVSQGDVDVVTRALGRDRRINPLYLRGAMGFGGPCFPRDNTAFAKFGATIGCDAELATTTKKINDRQVGRVADKVQAVTGGRRKQVSILGLAYKPHTNVIEASQALALAVELDRRGFRVHVHDPAVTLKSPSREKGGLIVESNTRECVAKSDVIVIAVPWPEFSHLDGKMFENKTLIDCWRVARREVRESSLEYVGLGLGK